MFHDFFRWLQEDLGRNICDPASSSWALQYHGSFNLWGLTEGTHVMTLILFAGTILLVDLRMLGVLFRNTPFSKINDKVLPLTIVGFAIMIFTGGILFLAKPLDYYHSVWFRAKMIFLLIASVNIFVFHFVVQKNQDEWDAMPKPPMKVRWSAILSLTSWTLIIIFGRFIAYNWFDADKLNAAIRSTEIAKAVYSGQLSDATLAKGVENSVITAPPAKREWNFGDTMMEGFLKTAYWFCECDKMAGVAPTLATLKVEMETPELVPENPLAVAAGKRADEEAAEVAKRCPAEPEPPPEPTVEPTLTETPAASPSPDATPSATATPGEGN